jgi:RNA polymerase sigma-70 factor, ECF subfamily
LADETDETDGKNETDRAAPSPERVSMSAALRDADPPQADRPDVGALYTAHVGTVTRWAERLAGPELDLEDIVHEVFFIAHRQLPRFRGDSGVATWLFGITDNVVRHRRRKERWRRFFTGPATANEEAMARVASPQPDPLRLAERVDDARIVYRLLDALPERDRRILILFELEEMSADEVGTLLAIRPANARLRLHRARARFLRAYQDFEDDEARKGRSHVTAKTV